MRAYLDTYLDSTEFFACWSKAFPATQRNYWGGLESDPVTLYANGVDGGEDWMYMIVVVPKVDSEVGSGRRLLRSFRVSVSSSTRNNLKFVCDLGVRVKFRGSTDKPGYAWVSGIAPGVCASLTAMWIREPKWNHSTSALCFCFLGCVHHNDSMNGERRSTNA